MTKQPTPFSELTELLENMQKSIEGMTHGYDDESFMASARSKMRVDIKDEGETFELTAELPGFDREDIDVRMTDRTLRIAAEREEQSEDKPKGKYIRQERRHRSVTRSIRLPEPVETAEISATYNNGVLTVRMPKREPGAQGTEIEIS